MSTRIGGHTSSYHADVDSLAVDLLQALFTSTHFFGQMFHASRNRLPDKMRILLNALPIHGPRSGVGHYTAELLRCLLDQARPEEQIRARPGPWTGTLRRLLQRSTGGGQGSGAVRAGGWKRQLAAMLKPLGRSLVRNFLR